MDNTHNAIIRYHQETSHVRGDLTGRALNRAESPVPFKLYRKIPTFHLSHDLELPDVPLDKVLEPRPLPAKANMPPLLAAICNLTAGITQIRKQPDGSVFHFRSVASAGALYPAELYFALQNVNGMNDGLYHFCPLEHTLSMLRSGWVFDALDETAPIIRFYLTSIYHRSSWKYGPRAYRYCLLDTGHMAENLLLATRMHGMKAFLDYDFNDTAITRFLGIDPNFEGCLAQVHVAGCTRETRIDESAPLTSDTIPSFSRSAPKAIAPDLLLATHTATSSFARCPITPPAPEKERTTPLPHPVIPASASATIMSRRSRRNFVPRTAPTRDLVDIISMLCRDTPPACTDAIQVGFIANNNSGLTPGYHRINRNNCSTTLVKPGNFMAQSARVCLDQGWIENSALHFVFTADIETLNQQCGPRAYRYAHLEAGRLGQRIYLAATAKRLGVCGIGAFFDQEATTLLSLPKGHVLLYLVAVGPVRK